MGIFAMSRGVAMEIRWWDSEGCEILAKGDDTGRTEDEMVWRAQILKRGVGGYIEAGENGLLTQHFAFKSLTFGSREY